MIQQTGSRLAKAALLAPMLFCGVAACALPIAAHAEATANSSAVAEVVVTARKRAENVQKIPLTVDVLKGDVLNNSGITSAEQIEYSVPGLAFGNGGFNGALLGLRGVSSQRGYTGDEAAVAVHIDGVFQPQSSQALARLFDIERIEVLKGPQGTLYGRNANAGVINVITKAPGPDREVNGQVSYGSFNTWRGDGSVNIPIDENNSVRFAVSTANGDGYIRSLNNDVTLGNEDFWAARARYKGRFGDNITVNAGVQVVNDKSIRDQALASVGYYRTYIDAPVNSSRRDVNWFFQMDADLGAVTLRSLTGGAAFKNDLVNDFRRNPPPSAFPNYGTQDGSSWSEELQLISKTPSWLDWRLGLYYSHSSVNETRNFNGDAGPGYYFYQDLKLHQNGDAYAVFGDATWHATDRFRINAGLRYNSETKQQTQDETHSEDAFGPGSGAPPLSPPLDCSVAYTPFVPPFPACNSKATLKAKWDGVTGRFGVEYDLTPTSLAYAGYGRGFRSGAIGGQVATDNFFDAIFGGPGTFGLIQLNPEVVDAYTAGVKNTLLDGRLILNAEAFYQIFNDMLFTAGDPNTFRFVEGNLGEAKVSGLDLYGAFRVTEHLDVSANMEFLHTEVTKIDPSIVFFPGIPVIQVGNELPRAPKFSASLAADYKAPIGSMGDLNLRAEYNIKGAHFLDLANTQKQSGFGLVNLSARFDVSGGRWYVFANGRNVTDVAYRVAGPIPTPGSYLLVRPGEPATYEVGFGFHF